MQSKPPREIVAIIELAVYLLLSLVAILLIIRHGIRSATTWLWVALPILILSGIRLAGAGLEIKSNDSQNANTAEQSTILDAVGLAPLTLLMIGLLGRAQATLDRRIPSFALFILQILSLGATALSVVGGKDVFGQDQSSAKLGKTMMKAGVILFIALFIINELLAIITLTRVRHYRAERVVAIVMLAAAPFFIVRLVYSTITAFTNLTPTSLFNPVSSSDTAIWVHFVMVVLMEMIVVILAELSSLASSRNRGGGKGSMQRESRGPEGYY